MSYRYLFRPTALGTIPACRRRLCRAGGRSAHASHLCCHPASGTVDTVDQTFDQNIGVETELVKAITQRGDLDLGQIIQGSVLQIL